MTKILSELSRQLNSYAEILLIYSDENMNIVNQYKWMEYEFYETTDIWTIEFGQTEININICEVVNADYDEDEEMYELEFNSGNYLSVSILN